ncbi:hypothetical protein FBU30_003055 [Linnemannia zychae]|nr:hypothetical protein FBU30_003055 [Linnemannia zychae]
MPPMLPNSHLMASPVSPPPEDEETDEQDVVEDFFPAPLTDQENRTLQIPQPLDESQQISSKVIPEEYDSLIENFLLKPTWKTDEPYLQNMSCTDLATKYIFIQQQEPITVSMVLVSPAHSSLNEDAVQEEDDSGSSSNASESGVSGLGYIPSQAHPSTTIIANAPASESEEFQLSEDEAGGSKRPRQEMSYVDRTLRHLTGQPQPPHEYAPESIKQAYRETGNITGAPLSVSQPSSSSSSSSSHAAASTETSSSSSSPYYAHLNPQSSHLDDDIPMDDEFGPTYFQGALND